MIVFFTAPEIWKPLRKLMNPSFSMKVLQTFYPILNEKITYLVENLNKQVQTPHFNILPFLNECTFEMISGKCLPSGIVRFSTD